MTEFAKLDDKVEIQENTFCPACSYDLRGTISNRCPECGYSLANMRSPLSQIPWVGRKERGRFRSYWQTVWMVTFLNRWFCEEYARPVGYSDARAFQWVTVVHVYVPVLLVVALVYLTTSAKPEAANPLQQMMTTGMVQPGPTFLATFLDRAYAEIWPVLVLLVCFLLFLAAATGVPSYFFHPRAVSARQQNSGIAMSYYACGPLALAMVPVITVCAAFKLMLLDRELAVVCLLASVVSSLVVLLTWWLNLVRITRRTIPQLNGRTVLIAVGVPLLWVALAGLILVGLPFLVLAVLVVLSSLG